MLRRYHFVFLTFLLIITCFVPATSALARMNNNFYYQQQSMRNQQMIQQRAQQDAMRRQQEAARRQQAEMRRQQQRQQQMMRERQQKMQAQMRQRQQKAAQQRAQIAERQRKMQEAKNRRLDKRNKAQQSQKMLAKQQQAIRQQQTLRQQRQLKERKDRLNRLQKDRFRKQQTNKKRKNASITLAKAALQSLGKTKPTSQQFKTSKNNKAASVKQFREKRLQQEKKQRITKQFKDQRKKTQAQIQKIRDNRKRLALKKQIKDQFNKKANKKTILAQSNKFSSCKNGVCKTDNCSFHGDTLVKTFDGFEPIKSLVVGDDQVWARNEITGQTNWQPVTALFSNHYNEIVEVSVRDLSSDKQQTIRSNRIHKFYVSDLKKRVNGFIIGTNSTGQWLEAQELKPSQRFINADGSESEVIAINIKQSPLKAFNITVDNYHTYFVKEAANDASAVWVHNSCHSKQKLTIKERYKNAVKEATNRYKGNVTVQRNGVDLFRIHQTSSGHGLKITQFVRRPRPSDGKVFPTPKEVPVRRRHVEQLEKALKGDPRYNLRTRGKR